MTKTETDDTTRREVTIARLRDALVLTRNELRRHVHKDAPTLLHASLVLKETPHRGELSR